MNKYRFIDLFAGIGGFHQALTNLGCECVCASEIDEDAIKRYKENFPDTPVVGDINKTYSKLPEFDILCGGFPCQPFSKAGKQEGFEDKTRGNLFYRIMDVLDLHPECKFVILENVKNLADKTENWDIIQNELKQRNFYITDMPIILSPHQFGIPQIRERVYILGIRKDIRDEAKLPNGSIHMEDLGRLFSAEDICSGDDTKKIEVKTTTIPVRIHHFKLEQLNVLRYDILVASIMLQKDDGGLSLNALIKRAKDLFSNNLKLLIHIENMVKNIDNDVLETLKYNKAYIDENIKFIKAINIPRVQEKTMDGVFNVEFDSDLSNTEQFDESEIKSWISF